VRNGKKKGKNTGTINPNIYPSFVYWR